MRQTQNDVAQAEQNSSQSATQCSHSSTSAVQNEFADLRPQVTAQRQLQDAANHSPQSHKLRTFQQLVQNSTLNAQLKTMNTLTNVLVTQRVAEEEQLQEKTAEATVQREAVASAPKPNNTGLPDHLKSGIESLSGMNMDHVKVHYNSNKPAQLHALAYAQGSDIHLAPGQQQHLPHEAWHVVQQAQGRVKPTIQMAGVAVNDDGGLEHEADVMGAQAASGGTMAVGTSTYQLQARSTDPVQRVAFNQAIGDLQVKGYYYLKLDGKDVMVQYLGTDNTMRGLGYWFDELGRGDRLTWAWDPPLGKRFYLLGSGTEDISPLESPEQYLLNLGFVGQPVDWAAEMALKPKHSEYEYTKLNDFSIAWQPIRGWFDVAEHTSVENHLKLSHRNHLKLSHPNIA